MSDARYLDIELDTGEMVRRRPLLASAGVVDAYQIVSTGADGKLDPSLIPSTGGPSADIATFVCGTDSIPAFMVVALIEERLIRASALVTAHAGSVVGVTLESGTEDDLINVQMGGIINFPTDVFGDFRGIVYLGSSGTLSPAPTPGSWFVQMLGLVISESALELDLGGWLVMLEAGLLPGEGSVEMATTSEAGIVILSEHGEMTPTEVVQADDPRVTGYHHTQSSANTLWTITHNCNMYPNVHCRNNSGETIVGEIAYTSRNQVTISFNQSVSGHAYLS
jgi:hypothetical protein